MKRISGVSFEGASYPVMEIDIFPNTDKEEVVFVSIDVLGDKLNECIRNVGASVAEAHQLDEQIFYYLTGEEFNLPEEEIRKILEDAVS